MIFNLNKFQKKITKNSEIIFLFLLIFVAVISTKFYNDEKKIIKKNYKNIINNTYFQKNIAHIFNSLTPKYKDVDHKVSDGETFDKILKIYSISDDEIIKIKTNLSKTVNLNSLKTNQIIKFTVDQSKNKQITTFLFPVSRTEKILLTRNLEKDIFEKKKIITNLNKRIV